MRLVDHARRELRMCGQYDEDPEYSESIIRAIEAFASYGHSGGSAGVAIHQLTQLLSYKNLSPLTDNPDEWMHVSDNLWQNKRNSEAFSFDGGKTYYTLSERDAVGGMDFVPFHESRSTLDE